MGGQTALNCALSLRKMGVLDKFKVELIGATADAIDKAEDRELFREAMTKIGLETPRSVLAHSLVEAIAALETSSACPRSSARASRSAAPAAASPTTAKNFSKSSSAASTPRRPTRC